jgi:hypothetical protein
MSPRNKTKILPQRLLETWANTINNLRKRWRWLGYALSIIALIYLIGIIIYGGYQLQEFHWKAFGVALLIALGLYLVSLIIQFIVWGRMLSFHQKIDWRDIIIYSRVILLRRLPGGFWHWLDRTAMYSETEKVPGRVVLSANFMEWAMLLCVAGAIVSIRLREISPFLGWLAPIILVSFALAFGIQWQPDTKSPLFRVLESGLWITIYIFAWILGGIIIFLYTNTAGGNFITWEGAVWVWAVAGGSSLLLFIFPTGLGIREITMTWLLQPYLSPANAFLVAILVRLTFTFADILWGLVGLGLSHRIHRQ